MTNSLHIITKSPTGHAPLWQAALSDGDGIILIEDGVYWLQRNPELTNLKTTLKLTLAALTDDVEARGLSNKIDNLKIINYKEFVELTTSFQRTVTW